MKKRNWKFYPLFVLLILSFSLNQCGGDSSPEDPPPEDPPGGGISTACGEATVQSARDVLATDGVYSDRVNLTWQAPFMWETVVSEGDAGSFGSLVEDSNYTLHASFRQALGMDGELVHAFKTLDGCWETEIIDAEAGVELGWYTSIDRSSDNTLHVSYYDVTNNAIKHASQISGGSWQVETVDTSVINSLQSTSMAVATDGSLHIVYKGIGGLRHAWKEPDNSSWQTEVVSSTMGQYAAIDAEWDGTLHLLFHTASTGGVSHAFKEPNGAWVVETVDNGALVGSFLDFTIEGTTWDTYFLASYYDSANQQLKAAWKSGSGSWNVDVVDSDGNVGWYTSIGLSSNATIHISYYDVDNADLKHAWKQTTEDDWNSETLDSTATTGTWTSLVVSPVNEIPHIIYHDTSESALKHAWVGSDFSYNVKRRSTVGSGDWTLLALVSDDLSYDDSSVTPETIYEYGIEPILDESTAETTTDTGYAAGSETIDAGNDVGKWSSITAAVDGTLHISYYDDDNNDLLHAWKEADSSEWNTETVLADSSNDVGEYSSIGVDVDGVLHISYFSQSDSKLKHAWGSPSGSGWSWNVQTIDNSGFTGLYTSLVIDDEGIVHIAYQQGGTDQNVRHAWGSFDGSSWNWTIETVDATDAVGWWNSIAAEEGGILHISYYDDTHGALKHAEGIWNDSTNSYDWATETVDDSADDVGEYTSILVSADDRIHISYYDDTNNRLKHAWKPIEGDSWTLEEAAPETAGGEFVGKFSSIAMGDDGSLLIAFYQAASLLGYVEGTYNSSSSSYDWSETTVLDDSSSTVGMYTDTVFDDGVFHISYYDQDNNALKYSAVSP